MVATRACNGLLLHSPAQPTSARLLSDGKGALTVMVFLFGLESSLECLRFDSLSAGAVGGAIVCVAGELDAAGCDVCSYARAHVQGVKVLCEGVMECGRRGKAVLCCWGSSSGESCVDDLPSKKVLELEVARPHIRLGACGHSR